MTSNRIEDSFVRGDGISAALRSMPGQRAPEGSWKLVLERYDAQRQLESRRRRYWGGGLAVAASIAVAVVGLRLGAGFFGEPDAGLNSGNPGPGEVAVLETTSLAESAGGGAAEFGQQLEQMDMDALVALSQFQERRLRALPLFDPVGPGQVVEVGSFGLTTELEDQIALLDEGLIPASLNAGDQAVPRRLMQERALLMEDLFDFRRAEAAQAGFIYADF